jgi:hypothetical protein
MNTSAPNSLTGLPIPCGLAQHEGAQPKTHRNPGGGGIAGGGLLPLEVVTLTDCSYSVSTQEALMLADESSPLYSPLVLHRKLALRRMHRARAAAEDPPL